MTKPLVSVVISAYNLAEYLPAALDSALAQQGVDGAVEVIVVDDGSTDATPEVLARYGDRIRSVRQENSGLVRTVSNGLGYASGEYVALLDADDVWPADHLARHVQALRADPSVGLVYGDAQVIDEAGAVTAPSFFALSNARPGTGRMLGRLLHDNCVTTSGMTMRALALRSILPLPSEAAFADWCLAVGLAAVSNVALVSGVSFGYRQRAGNMVLNQAPTAPGIVRNRRRMVEWFRWLLTEAIDDPTVSLDDVSRVLGVLDESLLRVMVGAGEAAAQIVTPDRARAAQLLMTARELPPGIARAKATAHAARYDPLDHGVRLEYTAALRLAEGMPMPEPPPPLITLPARAQATLAWAGEVLNAPALLHGFAREVQADDDASLVLLVRFDAEVQGLIKLFGEDPVLSGDAFHAVVIQAPATTPGRRWLSARATARLGGEGAEPEYQALPAWGR